jgi:exportin-7
MKIFYILRGIIRGLITNKQFNLFFDWFYPSYLSTIVEGALNAFYDDDEVVHVCIKLLVELVQNRNNRIRFDTWNINGLVVFKESAKYIIKLLQLWDCLR